MNVVEKLMEVERHAEITISSPAMAVMERFGEGPVAVVPESMWTATVTFYLFRPQHVRITVEFQEPTFEKLVDVIYHEYELQI